MGKSYFIIEIKSIKQGLKVLGQKENNTDWFKRTIPMFLPLIHRYLWAIRREREKERAIRNRHA